MQLTNNQKNFLRALANPRKPIVNISNKVLHDNVKKEILLSLEKHELLKIKIRANKEQKQIIIDKVITLSGANLIQVIGNVFVIYKVAAKNPRIILPHK